MKTNSHTHTTLSVPDSCIRPPGGLLLEKKYSLGSQTFGMTPDSWAAQDIHILAPGVSCSTQESCSIEDDEIPSFGSFFSVQSIDEVLEPGKLKSESDELSNLIKSTNLTLMKHGVMLSLQLSSKNFKYISSILKIMSSEVPIFPVGFLQKINLTQLLISQEPDLKQISNTFSLKTDVLDTNIKIEERLYKIIFDHSISAKPEISRDWKEHSETIFSQELSETLHVWSLEEVFIALMRNRTHPLLKRLMANLRKLLTEYFPEDLSDQWFEKRSLIKKRIHRVSFSERKYSSV